MVVRESP
jgi:hypothetical protein